MGAELNWQAVELVAVLMGVEDIEEFVIRLAAIRDWQAENRD